MNKKTCFVAGFVWLAAAHALASPPSSRWGDPVATGVVRLPRQARRTLLELSLESSPATRTLRPRLAAQADRQPGLAHQVLDLESFESPLARDLGIEAVPAFFFYEGRRLVARGTDALQAFQAEVRRRTQGPGLPRLALATPRER